MGTDEQLQTAYIPANFKEGTSVLGFMIRPLYVIQAVPFVAAAVLGVFIGLRGLSLTARLVITAGLCLPVVFLCIVGINGDSVFRFFRNAIRSKSTRRVCLYNPRIKTEIRPLAADPFSVPVLPRERVLALIERMKKERMEEPEEIDLSVLYFQDDEGIVEKPLEYMTPRERRQSRKKRESR